MVIIILSALAILLSVVAGGFLYRLGLKDGLKLNKDAGGARLDPAFTLPKIPSKEERERSKMENKKASEELARDIAVMDYKSKVKYDGER